MIKQYIFYLKPPKYANCLIYIKQCKRVKRLNAITQPVLQAFQMEGKVGFWCKRNERREGNACQETIVFCIMNIHQVNVEITPSFANHSSHFFRTHNPFPFLSNACYRGQSPLNKQFVAQLPWQNFSAVKSVIKFMIPLN